jgi:hypothetical protein
LFLPVVNGRVGIPASFANWRMKSCAALFSTSITAVPPMPILAAGDDLRPREPVLEGVQRPPRTARRIDRHAPERRLVVLLLLLDAQVDAHVGRPGRLPFERPLVHEGEGSAALERPVEPLRIEAPLPRCVRDAPELPPGLDRPELGAPCLEARPDHCAGQRIESATIEPSSRSS